MNQPIIEDILDQALAQLHRGHTLSEVLSNFPEQAEELKSLLEIAAIGYSVPHNTVPTPLRQRRFAEKAYRSWWLRSVSVLKFGIMPLSLVLILLGGKTFVDATARSLPNDSLYSIKHATEQLQLLLARTPDEQAALQVKLSEKRLDEVQQATASKNPAQEAAAITALKEQTQQSFATVSQVAATKAVTSNNSDLLNNLVAINKQQQQVLSAIQPQAETKAVAATALSAAQEDGKKLQTLLITVQEQTLADLKNKVSVTGNATFSKTKNTVTINDTTFTITDDTAVTAPDGTGMDAGQLPAAFKATIEGSKTDKDLIANIISIISIPAPTPAATTTTAAPDKSTDSKKVEPTSSTTTSDQSSPDPNQVTARIIVESPAPQYNK